MKSCISAGEQDNIPISIGEGKWYTLEIEKIKQNVQTQTNTGIPLFPYSGWGNFPSHGPQMPKHFNKGHIHHHIAESVQFLNEDTLMMKLIAMMTVIMTVILKTYIQPNH